jgi:hypothetical protein
MPQFHAVITESVPRYYRGETVFEAADEQDALVKIKRMYQAGQIAVDDKGVDDRDLAELVDVRFKGSPPNGRLHLLVRPDKDTTGRMIADRLDKLLEREHVDAKVLGPWQILEYAGDVPELSRMRKTAAAEDNVIEATVTLPEGFEEEEP